MSTITTTDFTIETSGYLSGSTHYFYAGVHNYLKVTRNSGSTATTLYLKVGDYDAITYNLKADGTAEIDITSMIRVYEGGATNMKFAESGTGYAIAVYHGMHADTYKQMLAMNGAKCEGYGINLYNEGVIPDTIYKSQASAVSLALPCAYNFGAYTALTGFSVGGNLVTIGYAVTLLRATSTGSSAVAEFTRRLKTEGELPLVKVELTAMLGRLIPYATFTGNKAVFYLELLSHKVDTSVTELQTIGDGYKAINEVTEQITIGLQSCTPYDYAYYMLMMLTAEDIEIDGEPCELATKSATIQAGANGRTELSITLKRKNYVTI